MEQSERAEHVQQVRLGWEALAIERLKVIEYYSCGGPAKESPHGDPPPLVPTLKRARELLAKAWSPDGCLLMTSDYEPMMCVPTNPRCRTWDVTGALEAAASARSLSGTHVARAVSFLDEMLASPVIAFPNDFVESWEQRAGRTQEEVLSLLDRAILRAGALDRAGGRT